jgi:hypothetical protein
MKVGLAFLPFLLLAAEDAAAQTPVDAALVLAVDASGSISEAEFRLQREGIAGAVTDAGVLQAIGSGIFGRIAIAYVEWGAPGGAVPVVDWAIVEDAASAEAFAAALSAAPRSRQSWNAIGDGIVVGHALFASCPCEPYRRIIDVSGDNPDSRSLVPAPVARDDAVADGITVNALAILQSAALGPNGDPLLVEQYRAQVIGGPGAFVLAAESRADFTHALRRKMILEIAAARP